MEEDKKPWEPTCNRFVAFLDIMGFKDMVSRKSHEEVYDILNGFSKISEQIGRLKPVSDLVYITKFSDSIVIFSKDDDIKTFGSFIAIVNIIFAEALIREVPIKGGIAHGKISVNKSGAIFFGQPIIDAYLLEEDVHHYGIACHSTIDSYIDKSIVADYNLFDLYLEKAILKSGNITHLMCDWYKNTNSFTDIYPDKPMGIKEIIKKLYLGVSGAPRRYIDNTLELYDRYLQTQEPHKDERDSNI